ncbi:MAG: hydroxymethylbilane synthase, partial [Kiloniellales bacterium]
VETRIAKLARGEADATLLALAGLKRLGLTDRPHRPLSTEEMLPAVAQGAIALEARSGDMATGALLAAIDHLPSRLRVTAERACLAALDGSCHTPIAALAELEGETLHLRGLVVLPDGSQAHHAQASAPAADARTLGEAVGAELRAKAGESFFAALAAST